MTIKDFIELLDYKEQLLLILKRDEEGFADSYPLKRAKEFTEVDTIINNKIIRVSVDDVNWTETVLVLEVE